MKQSNKSNFHNIHILRCREFIFSDERVLGFPIEGNTNRNSDASQFCLLIPNCKDLKENILQKLKKYRLSFEIIPSTDLCTINNALSYTIIARLSPLWNRVGNYLVNGRDFLMKRRDLFAIRVSVNTGLDGVHLLLSGHICNLPELDLSDIGINRSLEKAFLEGDVQCVPHNLIVPTKVNVLPSLKMGHLNKIHRKISTSCAIPTYQCFKRLWKNQYGYRLPEEESLVYYVDVTFAGFGQAHTFTYPSCCLTMLGNTSMLPEKIRDNGAPAIDQFMLDLHRLIPRILNSDFSRIDVSNTLALTCSNLTEAADVKTMHDHRKPNFIITAKEFSSVRNKQATKERDDTITTDSGPQTNVADSAIVWEDNDLFLQAVESISVQNNGTESNGVRTRPSSTQMPTEISEIMITPISLNEDRNVLEPLPKSVPGGDETVSVQPMTVTNLTEDRVTIETQTHKLLSHSRAEGQSSCARGIRKHFVAPKRISEAKPNCDSQAKLPKPNPIYSGTVAHIESEKVESRATPSVLRLGMSRRRATIVMLPREP